MSEHHFLVSKRLAAGAVLIAVAGCGSEQAQPADAGPEAAAPGGAGSSVEHLVSYSEAREPCANVDPLRMALFGDVHVHTSFSFDAAANSVGLTPTDAHRFARGELIPFFPVDETGAPAGTIRIDRPLDFLAVTDHGEFLGERALCRDSASPKYDSAFCEEYRSGERHGMWMLGRVITSEQPRRVPELCEDDGALCLEYAQGPWRRIVEAAEAAYDRSPSCAFTSFVGYEYTGTPGTSNYHRNVIFRNANLPARPVTYIDAPVDNLLWSALDEACGDVEGCDYLTIPHNSNLANGRMGPYRGIEPTEANRRAYAEQRQRREPIMEMFQHKGASECINGLTTVLGAPDELCDVEAVRVIGRPETYRTVQIVDGEMVLGEATEVTQECAPGESFSNGMLGAGCVSATDFIRSGLLVGLAEEREIGVNPIKLGMIAATDTHTSTPGAVAESDWRGHVTGESTPAERLEPAGLVSGIDGNPGGLAGVWAVENSRDAIFDAMLRREVFGTSGPRIVPRFFAGWDYDGEICSSADLVSRGYAGGVPMGGDLTGNGPGDQPVFIAWAARDPSPSAQPLESLQLIKGWIDPEGRARSRVISIAGGEGDESRDTLCAVYRDDEFDPEVPAYYYLRVVEPPTPRWSTFDCQRIPEADRPPLCSDGSYPETIREMAWTSPIWYRPSG
ncbi:MAG: DUF3604 domain-containing protein [Pseudomonadales bacterium]|nr:DUF3604 domain-containing protein [Pseudomonadales bacterium]NIX06794.1 DUF3604 domain-containing protein [Pseudomonadales bacterium]